MGERKDITASVTPDKYEWYATGPCHGIVKQFEPHKGRIVVPCNHNTTTSGAGRSHVIYSDDKEKLGIWVVLWTWIIRMKVL